jgi:prolipoprotein diacylglyceryltransferase
MKRGQIFWEDVMVRHPSQLYESLAYLAAFSILIFLYWKRNAWKRQGTVFGWFLVLIFGARFLLEFTKEPQVTERGEWLLNTSQLLSIPFVLVGVYLLWRAKNKAAAVT